MSTDKINPVISHILILIGAAIAITILVVNISVILVIGQWVLSNPWSALGWGVGILVVCGGLLVAFGMFMASREDKQKEKKQIEKIRSWMTTDPAALRVMIKDRIIKIPEAITDEVQEFMANTE